MVLGLLEEFDGTCGHIDALKPIIGTQMLA